ncbi:MAG: ferrochelatase [Sulfurovum sp.]|nr:ferrochelatase [Sulfurovum sp.]
MNKALFLLNMGGPNSINEIELFLNNMFADKNILTMDRYSRKFVSMIIIGKRLESVKKNYALIGGEVSTARIDPKAHFQIRTIP